MQNKLEDPGVIFKTPLLTLQSSIKQASSLSNVSTGNQKTWWGITIHFAVPDSVLHILLWKHYIINYICKIENI